MKKQNNIQSVKDDKIQSTCNVNSTFNFTVGGIAIAVAGVIGYCIYYYMMR